MKIVINISKDNFNVGSFDENSLREIILTEEQINEFDLKRRTLDENKSLEQFISEDIQDLVQNEIDNGLYGMFNY